MKKDPRAELLGWNIQHFRKNAGITQAQLAERINVSTAFVSRMERGEKGVSLKVLDALAEEFQVSYDALVREPGSRSRLETVLVLLEGRSEEYIAWIEKILRICGERPEE